MHHPDTEPQFFFETCSSLVILPSPKQGTKNLGFVMSLQMAKNFPAMTVVVGTQDTPGWTLPTDTQVDRGP